MDLHKNSKIKLNSGHEIPIIGLGTWQSKPGEVTEAVKIALDAGYRHIDGAYCYQNEKEVGLGINEKIKDGTIKREDVFVVSKLWDTDHRKTHVLPAIQRTLKDLGLSYLDLYFIHFPMSFQPSSELYPKDDEGNILLDDVDLLETWEAMEHLVSLGLTKSIGISNFNSQQIDYILSKGKIKPAVLQIEVHPFFQQNKLITFAKDKGIAVTAYSPFATMGGHPCAPKDFSKVLEQPVLKEIGAKYGKGASHVVIRWLIQRGVSVIPKSITKSRIIDNLNVFDFSLTEEDIKKIETLDKGQKGRMNAEGFDNLKEHKEWPFKIEF